MKKVIHSLNQKVLIAISIISLLVIFNTNTFSQTYTTVWSDDFSITNNWTISHAVGTTPDWVIMNSSMPGMGNIYLKNILGTVSVSSGNIIAVDGITNIVFANGSVPLNIVDAYCTASLPSLTGYSNLILKFNQKYYSFNSDTCYVEFSTDGGSTWTHKITVNPKNLVPANSFGLDSLSINVSQYISNQANVKIRFHWLTTDTDPIIGGGYGWALDNIKLVDSIVPVNTITAAISPSTVCYGTNTTLNITSGSLCSGASWNWYIGSCGGTFIGTGANLVQTPSSQTTYYVRALGACITSNCVSVSVDVLYLPSQPSAIIGSTSPMSGTTQTYNVTNVAGVSYTWTASSTWVGSSTSNSIVYVVGTTNGIVSVVPNNSCGAGVGKSLIIGSPTNQISGTFTYNNNSSTILDSLWVHLMYHGSKVDSIQADANGQYQFNNVPNGDFNIIATTHKAWGGVNITDVVLVKRHFGGSQLLTSSLRLHAADVNLSGVINISDGVKISRRFAGSDTSFDRGNWDFEKQFGGDTIYVSTYMNDTVIINNTNVIQDFKGICIGDVNGSAANINSGPKSAKITLNHNNSLMANENQYIELPLKVNGNLNVGAISLILNFPNKLVSISNVMLVNKNQNIDLIYHAKGNELRIAWFETDGEIIMNENDTYIILKLKTTNNFKQGDEIIFDIADNYLCELADYYGTPIDNVIMTTSKIEYNTNKEISTKYSFDTNINIYPNPFNEFININYNLNKDSKVMVELSDILGKTIKTIVNTNQIKGNYNYKFYADKNNFSSNQYQIKFTVDGMTYTKKAVWIK